MIRTKIIPLAKKILKLLMLWIILKQLKKRT